MTSPNHNDLPDPDARAASLAALGPEELLAHSDWLRALARSLVGTRGDADDLAQEALGNMLRSRVQVRDLRAYLGQSVRNLAFRRQRSEASRKDREARVSEERPTVDVPSDELGERVELLQLCLQRLGTLPDAQRRSITLRFLDGLSFEDIAAREGVKASTVRSNVTRGLDALRAQLDEHAGSRSAWCMAIGPWAFRGFGGFEAAAAETFTTTTKGASAATAATAPAGASLAAGLIAMLMKPTVGIAATCLAGLAGWLYLKDAPEQTVRAVEPSADIAVGGDEPVTRAPDATQLASANGERREREEASAEGDSKAKPTSAPALFSVEGVAVDAETGEYVPEISIGVRGPEDAADPSASGKLMKMTRAGERGQFIFEDLRLPEGEVEIWTSDINDDFGARRRGSTPVAFPFDSTLPVRVGPTFTVNLTGAMLADGTRLLVTAAGSGIALNTETSTYFPRLSKVDWLRFSEPFGTRSNTGPWTLAFRSEDGLAVADVDVDRRAGIEASPLTVALEPRGAIEFHVSTPDGSDLPKTTIDITSDHLDAPQSFWIVSEDSLIHAAGSPGQVAPTTPEIVMPYLEAGAYTWTIEVGGAKTTGEVDVVTGERLIVEVMTPAPAATAVHVSIDASAAPDVDLSEWPVQFFRADDVTKHLMSSIERDEAAGVGMWRASLETLPAGDWSFVVGSPDGFDVTPLPLDVSGSAPSDRRVTVTPISQTEVTLVVSVKDAKPGDSLPASLAVHHANGARLVRLEADVPGTFTTKAPAAAASSFIVSADGYNLTRVDYEPGRDSTSLAVEITPGTRTRTLVIDTRTLAPLEGIEFLVDGESIGKSDARGEVWFSPETPPSEVEIAAGSKSGLTEMMTPSTPGNGINVRDKGYMFFVTTEAPGADD